MAKWRLDGSEPRTDGTGAIALDIWGLDDDNNVIPGRHTTILLDAQAVQDALDLSTNPERNAALKALVEAQLDQAQWSNAALDQVVIDNALAASVDANLDAHVAGLGDYPISFTL